MVKKLYVLKYIDLEIPPTVVDELPPILSGVTRINVYRENGKSWQGTVDDWQNLSTPLQEDFQEIYLKLVKNEIPQYISDLENLINNHLSISMTGIKVILFNTDIEPNVPFDYELDWIDSSTDPRISENYKGLFENGRIYVEKPSRYHTPIILIHEIFHTLGLTHRSGGNQNIMGNDFLNTNYKISTQQITRINDQIVNDTINESILPPTPCVLLND